MTVRAQKLDLNGNGLSDVWEWKYNAVGVATNLDSDGDGVPNYLEAIAGTDPFDSNSVPRITVAGYTSTNFSVKMPSALGKYYQLQSSSPPTNGAFNWNYETGLVARSGTNVTLTAPVIGAMRFFRVVVSDVDTDGDGLSDWEEYQLGLDPTKAASNGQLDVNGQPIGDYAFAAAKLAFQNVVSITASDPYATQPDVGQSPLGFGEFMVTRGGFPLNAITVKLGTNAPGPGIALADVDYASLPASVVLPAGVSSQTVSLVPLANTNRVTPVLAALNLLPGTGYTLGAPTNASVLIYPSPSVQGTGLTGEYYTNSNVLYTNIANFYPSNRFLTRLDSNVDFTWYTNLSPNLSNGSYTVRWTGQVQPEFSETYYFEAKTDDGFKLWVNDQLLIDKWTNTGVQDLTAPVNLQGGVRYDIRLDYFNNGASAQAHLYWYSASQPKQIIPANRLYPATNAPTAIVSSLSAVAFLNQQFSYTVTGANLAGSYTAVGLPPGLNFNTASGLISGAPTSVGDFQVALTASNGVGLAAAVLDLQVIDTGSSVVREIWSGIAGTNISDIPVGTPATLTNTLDKLEGITGYSNNYGERIRGYLTAPTNGNYYFWIAGNDTAELWISNDSEPVNKVKRASAAGTASRQWSLQANQRSPWLALAAGQRYYFEILHKAGSGTNDNWAVAWLQDAAGTNTVPPTNSIVPGYVLGRFYPLPPIYVPGTLFSANMLAQAGIASDGIGSATLRLSADGTQAILKFNDSNLSSPVTGEHIHNDPYLNYPSQIMFDIDTAPLQPDGSYVWNIGPVGAITNAADIVEIIREGKAYINIHTANFPAGEINGHFSAVDGSQTFTPPPAPPTWADDHNDPKAAARFLNQATFGANATEISNIQILGYSGWLAYEFSLTTSHHLPNVLANPGPDPNNIYFASQTFNTWWQQSVTAPDQLRQRVAFVLSEIMVVSQQGVLENNSPALSSYYDTLLDHSFGNFRQLLESATLTPAMGLYLDMRANDKGNLPNGTHANENYAREILQLFSIGLNRLWPDGTLVLDSQDNLVPTYDQNVIMGFAADFTGWNYYQPNQTNGHLPASFPTKANYTNAMVLVPTHHDLNTKRLLDNVILPAAQGSQIITTTTNFDNYCSQDLESALDSIFNNQNVGPFVCRQLIQRLVTSNPSRDYLYRVVQKFNDNGSGVRGDMQAVIRAILLDYEARSAPASLLPTFGKQREPLIRVTAAARAFPSPPTTSGTYTQGSNRTIAVTTSTPHQLNNNDTVALVFTEATTNAQPASQPYGVTVTGSNTFNVNAAGMSSGSFGQVSNIITVTNSGHGLSPGNEVYLYFTTAGPSNGVYTVATAPTNTFFTVTASNSATFTGSCLFPKITGGGYLVQGGTNVTITTPYAHGLSVGDIVYITFARAIPPDGEYQVLTAPNSTNFTVVSPVSGGISSDNQQIFPLTVPVFDRNGSVVVQFSSWNIGATDTGTTSALSQTPLNSPTVFNFYYPDYRYPGTLASAGLTTPEFQLTSDSSVALQMNYLEGGILATNSNVNGLSSFANGNGSIVLNFSPWMTTNYTANTGISNLIDSLSTMLVGGQLSAGARTGIINYVANTTNFPYNATPTSAQMAARVRAATHLILCSPDFTIQR